MGDRLTLRQIAGMAGVSKQAVSRYLRKHGYKSSGNRNGAKLYDRKTVKPALDHWKKSGKAGRPQKTHEQVTVFLQDQIKEKDRQIANLTAALAHQQELQAATLQQLHDSQNHVKELEKAPEHASFWQRLKQAFQHS